MCGREYRVYDIRRWLWIRWAWACGSLWTQWIPVYRVPPACAAHSIAVSQGAWIPAFAGMTNRGAGVTKGCRE